MDDNQEIYLLTLVEKEANRLVKLKKQNGEEYRPSWREVGKRVYQQNVNLRKDILGTFLWRINDIKRRTLALQEKTGKTSKQAEIVNRLVKFIGLNVSKTVL